MAASVAGCADGLETAPASEDEPVFIAGLALRLYFWGHFAPAVMLQGQ